MRGSFLKKKKCNRTEYPQPFINSLSVSFSDCTPTLVTATSGTATVTTVQSFFGYPLPTPTPMVSPVVEDSGGYLVVYLSASEPTPCGTPKRLSRRFYIFMTVFVCLFILFFSSALLGCVQQLLTGSTFAVCTDTSTSAIPSSSLAALIPTIPVEGGPAYIPPALQEPGIIPVIVPHINF